MLKYRLLGAGLSKSRQVLVAWSSEYATWGAIFVAQSLVRNPCLAIRMTANRFSPCSLQCSFSEEHTCDASLTEQLLPRLHMLHSMRCSSAVQHLIKSRKHFVVLRIRSLISTCSVAVWQNCTEGNVIGIVDAESANNQAIHRAKSRTTVSMRALQSAL